MRSPAWRCVPPPSGIILALFRTFCPGPETRPLGKQSTGSSCSPTDAALCPRDSYVPRDSSLQSETVRYKRGVCQQFCVPSHTVDPSEWTEEEVSGVRRDGVGCGTPEV